MEGVKVLHFACPPPIQASSAPCSASRGPICGVNALPQPGPSFQPAIPRQSPSFSRSEITRTSGRRVLPQDHTSPFSKPTMMPTGGKLQASGKTCSKLFTGESEQRAGKKCATRKDAMDDIKAECNYPMPRLHRPTAEEYSGRAGTTTDYINHNMTGIKTFSQKSGEEVAPPSGKRHFIPLTPSATEFSSTSHRKPMPFLHSDPFGSISCLGGTGGIRRRPMPGPSAEMQFKQSIACKVDKFTSDSSTILHTAPPTKFDITGPISIDMRKPAQSTAAMMAEYHATCQKAAELKAREYNETQCY